jgi:hypothetical protein
MSSFLGGGGSGGSTPGPPGPNNRTIVTVDTIYFVDPNNGSDSNDGLTLPTAFKTIQHAINIVCDTLYFENVAITIDAQACTVGGTVTCIFAEFLTLKNYSGVASELSAFGTGGILILGDPAKSIIQPTQDLTLNASCVVLSATPSARWFADGFILDDTNATNSETMLGIFNGGSFIFHPGGLICSGNITNAFKVSIDAKLIVSASAHSAFVTCSGPNMGSFYTAGPFCDILEDGSWNFTANINFTNYFLALTYSNYAGSLQLTGVGVITVNGSVNVQSLSRVSTVTNLSNWPGGLTGVNNSIVTPDSMVNGAAGVVTDVPSLTTVLPSTNVVIYDQSIDQPSLAYNNPFDGTIVGMAMPTYNAAGVPNPVPHSVIDNATIGGGGSVTITLTGPAQFTSATSYTVTANDTTGVAAPVSVQNVSGASFTIFGVPGHTVNFVAVGT